MAEKFYTIQQMALAALKKYQELQADLVKANTSHETEAGQEPSIEDADCPEQLAADGSTGVAEGEKKKKKEGEESESEDGVSGEEAEFVEEKAEESADEEVEEHEEEMHEESEDESEEDKKKAPFQKSEELDLNKARVDEGKSNTEKRQSREKRNDRQIGSDSGNAYGTPKDSVKGVHKELFDRKTTKNPRTLLPQGKGTSTAGAKAKDASRKENPYGKKEAREEHKKVFREQRSMKKPSLPKSEECGSKKEMPLKKYMEKKSSEKGFYKGYKDMFATVLGDSAPVKKKEGGNIKSGKTRYDNEKGVHKESYSTSKRGTSDVGYKTKNMPDWAKKGKTSLSAEYRDAPKSGHRQVIAEQKDMKKPSLPKSEQDGKDLQKARSDKDLHPNQTGEKGVHLNSANPKYKGQSVAGMDARLGKEKFSGAGMKSSKTLHAKKLKEIKDMPKPSLPKSEEASESSKVEQFLGVEKK